MKISVIIPVYREENLPGLLADLLDRPDLEDTEVLVVRGDAGQTALDGMAGLGVTCLSSPRGAVCSRTVARRRPQEMSCCSCTPTHGFPTVPLPPSATRCRTAIWPEGPSAWATRPPPPGSISSRRRPTCVPD